MLIIIADGKTQCRPVAKHFCLLCGNPNAPFSRNAAMVFGNSSATAACNIARPLRMNKYLFMIPIYAKLTADSHLVFTGYSLGSSHGRADACLLYTSPSPRDRQKS